MSGVTLITGAGRYSLGEAIAMEYRGRDPNMPIIVIGKEFNPEFQVLTGVHQITYDLNPLNHSGGLAKFAIELFAKLDSSVRELARSGVKFLIQTAGVYDFGNFLDYDAARRANLLGLNVLGTAEVLHAVMELNAHHGQSNSGGLTHLLVGAFQGLYIRSNRSLYASSKAWGIDFCASLAAGGEVARCLYAAPVPIDTPMLHRNHWVAKAAGCERLFEFALRGSPAEYDSIFRGCDEGALSDVSRAGGFEMELNALLIALEKYRVERSNAYRADLGVITAKHCAAALLEIMQVPESKSGVYLIGAKPPTKFATFSNLNRYDLFRSVAK